MDSGDDQAQPSVGSMPEANGAPAGMTAATRDAQLPDLDWTVLPDGVTAGTFSAPSGPLAVISMGVPGNPCVLLVPGATGSKEDFVLMMPVLVAAGFHVLSYDLAGQYESAPAGPENLVPPRPSYDYELFVGDFIAVMESLRLPAHVVGYSFAGTVAQLVYARRPELFRSLTLLSCPPLAGQCFRGVSRIGPFTVFATARAGAALMIWGIRQNIIPVPPGRLRFVKDRLRVTRRQSVRDIMGLMMKTPDLRRLLAEAPLPKLVAVGEHDLWPSQLHREFAYAIGARLSIYASGHSPGETSPYQLCEDLLALFAEADGAAPDL
jgi:pimeloyl-ACP methyl ester carboxylesterase